MPTSVPTSAEFDALAARVAKLETGTTPVPPEPPVLTPSPSGSTLTGTSGVIIDAQLQRRTLMLSATDALQVARNNTPDTTTRNVVLLLFFEGKISQQNAAGNWYVESPTYTWSQIPGDPRVPVVPAPPSGPVVYNPGAPRPEVQRDGNAITCALSMVTPGRLNKHIFGVASASLASGPPWDYRMLKDANAAAAMKRLGLSFVRVLGGTSMTDLFGTSGGDTPDWSKIDNLLLLPQVFPGATLMLCLCYGWLPYDWNNAGLRQKLADNYALVARHFEDHGLHIPYWEPLNEPDGAKVPPNVVADFEAKVRGALKRVDPTYKVGGPVTTYLRGEYSTPSAAAGGEFISWHAYHHGPGNFPGDQVIWDDAVAWGDQPPNAQSQARAGRPGNYESYITEHNINYYSGDGNDPRQQTWQGAVFTACAMIAWTYGGAAGTTIWRLENDDGTYGVFATNTWNVNPNGALITELCRRMPAGPIMSCTVKSTTSDRLLALGSADQSNFGLALVNYHANQPWQGGVALPGRNATTALNLWRQDSAAPLGVAEQLPVGSMAQVRLPPGSIMILSGAR